MHVVAVHAVVDTAAAADDVVVVVVGPSFVVDTTPVADGGTIVPVMTDETPVATCTAS